MTAEVHGVCPQVKHKLLSERDRLFRLMSEISYLQPYPSHANFILAKVCALEQ